MEEIKKEDIPLQEKPILIDESQPLEEKLIVINETEPLAEKPTIANESQSLKEKLTAANESQPLTGKPTGNTDLYSSAIGSVLIFGSTGLMIFFTILAALPIAQIVIGQQYVKDCPVNSNIPIYQIVSGAVGLANILLIVLVGIVSVAFIRPAMTAAENNSNTEALSLSIGYCCIICCITMFMMLLSVFMLVWTILGLVWLINSWSSVQYLDPNLATYCSPVMYRFHFWLFILPFLLGPVICCIPCCMLCCTLCALPNTSNSAPYTSTITTYASSSAPNTSSPTAITAP